MYRLQDQDLSPPNIVQTKKALLQYFGSSSFMRRKCANKPTDQPAMTQINAKDTELLDLLMIPYKNKDDSPEAQCESYVSSLWKLRDQVSFYPPFSPCSYSPWPCFFKKKNYYYYIRKISSVLRRFCQ